MDYYGYAGNILKVDLTTGKVERQPLDLDLARRFIGSCGLNYRMAYDLMRPGSDPLSPESPIMIGAGPLIGTMAPGSGQVQATIKFPHPGSEDNRYYVASASGGSRHFGVMMKCAGYDNLLIEGKSDRPVYLKVFDDDVEICDASDLWGKKDIFETTDELVARHGRCGVIAIGAAGENLVRFALSMMDNRSTLGRNGLGALMGSKNLKAIVTRGSKGVRIADSRRFMRTVHEIRQVVAESPHYQAFHKLALHAGWEDWKINLDPGKMTKEKWEQEYGPHRAEEATRDIHACTGCVLGCRASYAIKDGPFAGGGTQGAHFVHFATFSQILNLSDWREVVKLEDICTRSGMCMVAFTTMAVLLTALFRSGSLTLEDTDGLALTPDFAGYSALADRIVRRQGFASVLGEGWFAMGKKYGIDVNAALPLIKGSLCLYDPRSTKIDPRILTEVVNPRGAHHPQGHWTTSSPMRPLEVIRRAAEATGASRETVDRIFDGEGFNTGRLTRHVLDSGMVMDSVGVCTLYPVFGFPVDVEHLAELYSAATGIETTAPELKLAGERAQNMLKLLNVREGFSRKDDVFPPIWFRPKKTATGPEVLMDYYRRTPFTAEDVGPTLDDYYDERGWDIQTGIPTRQKLAELGLGEFSGALDIG